MTIPGIYSQRDARWSGYELGYNNDPNFNLYHYGCLVTGVANMLWYNGNPTGDPGAVNQWMKDHGGFQAGGGLLIWGALQPLLDQVNMSAHGFSGDLNAINEFLKDDNAYAIAWLTKPGFDMHWSVMPYVNTIADSWDGVLKPVSSYTFHGAYLFSKNPAPQPAAPIVVPPVVEPPIEPPVAAPTPEPIPTNTDPQPEAQTEVPAAIIVPEVTKEPEMPIVETPKPGVKTSEFYVTLALLALPLVNHYLGTQFSLDEASNFVVAFVGTAGSVVAAVTYIIGRLALKAK